MFETPSIRSAETAPAWRSSAACRCSQCSACSRLCLAASRCRSGQGSVGADLRAGVRDEAGDDAGVLRVWVPRHHRPDEGVHEAVPERRRGTFARTRSRRSRRMRRSTLGGPNPPDLMRLPQDQRARQGPPAEEPRRLLQGSTAGASSRRRSWPSFGRRRPVARVGSGPLWAMGVNYSLTGVFYNKALAKKIGMTSAPTTLAQLDALLAKAKAAGITPIEQFNGGATGGLLFPLQQLMAIYGSPPRSTTGSSTSRARTSTRPSNLTGDHAPAEVDQGRLLQLGRQRRPTTRR